jgi:1,4-alpha-glucan branching enzyme
MPSEKYVLPISHDEVVHGKGIAAGQDARRSLAAIRQPARLSTHSCGAARQEAAVHGNLVRDLNRLYRETPALHARDCEGEGFEWLIGDDAANSVFAWLRKAPGEKPVAVIANLTPVARAPYRVPLPHDGRWREIINSDAHHYWGSGLGNMGGVDAKDGAAWVTLPPLATIMLQYDG